jgi:hypothetical protein
MIEELVCEEEKIDSVNNPYHVAPGGQNTTWALILGRRRKAATIIIKFFTQIKIKK